MASPTAKSRVFVPVTLLALGLAVCAWQIQEHIRFRENSKQALIDRGRDITRTLGVLLHSQRQFFGSIVVSKDRLESALQDLVRPEELESIAVLGATGTTIAQAGTKVDLTPDMLGSGGPYWHGRTVTIMNLMDLGTSTGDDGARSRPPILVTEDERQARALAFPSRQARRGIEPQPVPAPGGDTTRSGTAGSETSPRPSTAGGTDGGRQRAIFGRPPGMPQEEYDSLIQKQGMHSLVLSLSTEEMHRKVKADLLLRSLVSLFALGGALVSSLAWRNLRKSAELQIRLVKAGEMNAHLKEMNLSAAGLAHETRNPLNLIRGLAHMIANQPDASLKMKDHASTILEEADRVTVQLNEFINYSKPREPHFAPVDVARLVTDLGRTLVPDLEEKRITFVPPEPGLRIEADEALLRQTLFNVLINATQAVDVGGRIEVRLTAVDAREAILEVRDDGPGVPAEHRATIFKPYVTMREKGVGLGLAIVAQIAAAHHWDVACVANEPRGAVFRFSHLKIAA